MNFDVACYSEQGGRPVNEDAVFAAGTPGTLLTLVADGLGGMGHGDLASRDAAEHLSRLSTHPVDAVIRQSYLHIPALRFILSGKLS